MTMVELLRSEVEEAMRWAVFEPNDERLWAAVRLRVGDLLAQHWREGDLLGNRQDEAFFVRCDRSTMAQTDLEAGRLVCFVGVAVVQPAEFVVLRVVQPTGEASDG